MIIIRSQINHNREVAEYSECGKFVRTALSPTNEDHRPVFHLGDAKHA